MTLASSVSWLTRSIDVAFMQTSKHVGAAPLDMSVLRSNGGIFLCDGFLRPRCARPCYNPDPNLFKHVSLGRVGARRRTRASQRHPQECVTGSYARPRSWLPFSAFGLCCFALRQRFTVESIRSLVSLTGSSGADLKQSDCLPLTDVLFPQSSLVPQGGGMASISRSEIPITSSTTIFSK